VLFQLIQALHSQFLCLTNIASVGIFDNNFIKNSCKT
jgi:hypothetical protein